MRLPTVLLPCLTAFVLVPAAGAQAAVYCVPTLAACPGGAGIAKADLQSALDLADNAPDSDGIYLGSGTFTSPTTAGFAYDAPTGPVHIVGKGRTGATRTVLTTPAPGGTVLKVKGASGSSVEGLELAIADNTLVSRVGLSLEQVAASDIAVTASPTQTNSFQGVALQSGSSLRDSSVALPLPGATQTSAVLVGGPGVSLARNTLVARTGLSANSSAVSIVAERLRITAKVGVDVGGSTLTLRASTITVPVTSGAALSAIDQPATDGRLDADGVTLVGTVPGSTAVVAGSINSTPRKSTVTVRNSIVTGLNGRSAFAFSTGSASVSIGSSDFDPSGDKTGGSGATSLSPPAGQLGTTNINADPQFVSSSDLHLSAGSPAIDAGDPATAAGLDLDGISWLLESTSGCAGRRDMGAYEYQPGTPCTPPPADPTPPVPTETAPFTPHVVVLPPPVPRTTPAPDRTAPKVTALRVRRGVLSFRLSERARTTVVRTRGRQRSTTRRTAAAGTTRLRLPRGLRPGRYTVRVTAVDAAGNRGRSKLLRLHVTAARRR